MKRILILVAVVVLLLLLGGAAWYFLVYSKSTGPSTAAEMVPASAPAFVWLPQVPKSLEKFKATPVYALWKEKSVQDAVAKLDPLKQASTTPVPAEAKKVWDLVEPLWNNFQGEAFLAVTSVKVDPSVQVDVIGGFQIGPDPTGFLAWTEKVKTSFPDLKWQEKDHPTQKYYLTETTYESKKITICVAQWNSWVLLGVGESSFLQLLDRIHSGKPDATLCLSGQPAYTKFLSQQPQGFDTLTYINPIPLLNVAQQAIEKKTPGQKGMLKAYQGMEALMLTSTIEGPDFRDRVLLQSPKDKRPDYGDALLPLKGTTARFTSAQTLVYSAQNVDLAKTLDQIRAGGPDEQKLIDEGIASINKGLSGIPLDLGKDIIPKLGPEYGFILDWGVGKPFPDLTLALEHKDQAMVRKLVDFLVTTGNALSGGKVPVKNGDIAGDPTYLVAIPMSPVAPAIWIGKEMLLLTLNGAGLETMVKRTGSGLLDTEPYKALAGKSVIKKPSSLAYVDVEQLVMFSHGALSNLLPMIAGLAGTPELAQTLPPVDNLKPYLGHWLVLSDADDSGFRMEGIYEKGHPLVYGAAGIALIADFAKALAPLAAKAGQTANAPAPTSDPSSSDQSTVDPSLVLQDLVDIDDAISSWSKDKKIPEGSAISWNDIIPYFPENSQVATRIGLDPLGNAYIMGKTGPGQVVLSPATQKHFEGKVPEGFWGKFTSKPQGELPTP